MSNSGRARFRWRTWFRRRLPRFLVDWGVAGKGTIDCGGHDRNSPILFRKEPPTFWWTRTHWVAISFPAAGLCYSWNEMGNPVGCLRMITAPCGRLSGFSMRVPNSWHSPGPLSGGSHYTELRRYLFSNFQRVIDNDRLLIFDLTGSSTIDQSLHSNDSRQARAASG